MDTWLVYGTIAVREDSVIRIVDDTTGGIDCGVVFHTAAGGMWAPSRASVRKVVGSVLDVLRAIEETDGNR